MVHVLYAFLCPPHHTCFMLYALCFAMLTSPNPLQLVFLIY